MTPLEQKLGYVFQDQGMLKQALTHRSYANEKNTKHSNERLEFLGDAVLGFVTARFLYRTYPELPEGELTRRRAALVCENSLAALAARLELGEALRLGQGERATKGCERASILSDAFEAVLGAMLLDGGLAAAEELLGRLLLTQELDFSGVTQDSKTVLQERVQRVPGRTLRYQVVSEQGPDHAKTFVVEALMDGEPIGRGEGGTKKKAEQNAARQALDKLPAD